MKKHHTLIVALAMVLTAAWMAPARAAAPQKGPGAPDHDEGAEKASHKEGAPFEITFKRLASLCLDNSNNILACDSGASEIKVINPDGKLIATWTPGFRPEAIDVAADGTIYCGGEGKVAILDKEGKVTKTVDTPSQAGKSSRGGRKRARSRKPRVSGMAASDKDLFVAFGTGGGTGSRSSLYRFDRQLENPKKLAERLRGCCQRLDMVFKDNVLYVAENGAHRVVKYDREGIVLAKWGSRGRLELEKFGSCCNPMNLCFDKSGNLYTSESGLGRVKKYSTDGTLIGLIGYSGVDRFTRAGGFAISCSNMAFGTVDGSRFFVMDFRNKKIRVLDKK